MLRILIVDDDEMIRDIMAATLRSQGYEVDTAVSGAEGLEKLRKGGFDRIITDYEMPGMNGMQFAGKVRSMYPTMPIVMATANPYDVPVIAVVAKPMHADDLTVALDLAARTMGVDERST